MYLQITAKISQNKETWYWYREGVDRTETCSMSKEVNTVEGRMLLYKKQDRKQEARRQVNRKMPGRQDAS